MTPNVDPSTPATHRTAYDRIQNSRATGKIYTGTEFARILDAELVPAPAAVAEVLGVEVGASVIRRRRVTLNKEADTPLSASTSWFHCDLAAACPALLVTERLPEGTPAYIERATGRRAGAGGDEVAADRAAEGDAELLQIAVGDPVKRVRNWVLDFDGNLMEYGESVAAALRWSTYGYDFHSAAEG